MSFKSVSFFSFYIWQMWSKQFFFFFVVVFRCPSVLVSFHYPSLTNTWLFTLCIYTNYDPLSHQVGHLSGPSWTFLSCPKKLRPNFFAPFVFTLSLMVTRLLFDSLNGKECGQQEPKEKKNTRRTSDDCVQQKKNVESVSLDIWESFSGRKFQLCRCTNQSLSSSKHKKKDTNFFE